MPTSHPLAGEPDPEALITCPYNQAHRILRKRMQFHLTKCSKSYPNAKKQVCPYNATHMINEQEFKFHLEVCDGKGVIDNYKYRTENQAHVIELPPQPVMPPAEENWDNEQTGSYDPSLKLDSAPIIHSLIGGTRSERKRNKIQQRQKFRALDETGPSMKVQPKVEKKLLSDDQPLRQPTSLPSNFLNNSAQYALLNRSFASEVSAQSTSKQQGGSGVFNNERKEGPASKLRNAVAGVAEAQNRPGPSELNDDDGFIVFRTKGRGKFIK